MKKILIIILLALLAVVGYNYPAPTQDTSNGIVMTNEQKNIINNEGQEQTGEDFGTTLCYQHKGIAEDMTDNRELSLGIYRTTVTGTKLVYNSSNEYSIGYEGAVEGELDSLGGDTINAITTLTISGDEEIRQEERYIIDENSITEMRYRLREDFETNILRIDESVTEAIEGQTFPIEYEYEQVNCLSLNDSPDDKITKLAPSSYICFEADEEEYGAFNKVMLALDKNERAQYAQYKNNEELRTIDLAFVSKDIPDSGFATYTLTYDASLENGLVFGRYAQTHSGIYDYLEFTNNDGEVFNFTNILDESYISQTCL